MADNPLNIDALNGINFDNDDIMAVIAPVISQNTFGGYDIKFFNSGSSISSVGKISVVNKDFVESNLVLQNGYQYYNFATFGAIQFEGDPQTYWVHGFTENGLLLSAGQNLLTYAPEGQPLDGSSGLLDSSFAPTNTFIFGTYGVVSVHDGGGNPNAVAWQNASFNKDSTVFTIPEGPVVCFAETTGIATPTGRVAVERLNIGDSIVTASGAVHPVQWIGELTARPARHPRPHEVNPVCVRAGAFGEGLPERDLRLSPGHAVYVDGVLVPVGHLVNGATIVQEEVEQIRYFHIELESHDVLLAEGLPCESYLDDGNRRSFLNSGENVELYGRLDPKSWDDACAPLVADGPQLAAIRLMLHARAEALGWTRCEEADLVIEADGVAIPTESNDGTSLRFTVPAAASVVLRSNAGVLGQVMPELADRRMLGVAVSGLMVNGNAVDLDAALFGAGFYQVERQDALAWRWSDGAGTFELGGKPATIEVSLAMVAPSWKRSAAVLRIAA